MRRASLLTRLRDALARAQDRSPLADRAVRTVDRYLEVQGSLLAAGMTYYAFLALFPLMALGLAIASLLSLVAPKVDDTLKAKLHELMPSLDTQALATAGITVGLVSLGVMVYAGVRWVGALRRSLTLLAGRTPREVPYVRGLVRDLATLALLGASVLLSVALSVLSQSAASIIGSWAGEGAGSAAIRLLGLAGALVTDFLLAYVLFRSVSDTGLRGRRLVTSAVVAGLGFEVFKQLGTLIVSYAARNVVYGSFAATVGLLVWISYVSRWVLIVGAWAVTGAGLGPRSEPGAPAGRGGEPAGGHPLAVPAPAETDGTGTGEHRRPDPQREPDLRRQP